MKAFFTFINDSCCARILQGIDSRYGNSDIFYRNNITFDVIPQISVILMPCVGGACYSQAICDYICFLHFADVWKMCELHAQKQYVEHVYDMLVISI